MSGHNVRKQRRLLFNLLGASYSSPTSWICAPCRMRLANTEAHSRNGEPSEAIGKIPETEAIAMRARDDRPTRRPTRVSGPRGFGLRDRDVATENTAPLSWAEARKVKTGVLADEIRLREGHIPEEARTHNDSGDTVATGRRNRAGKRSIESIRTLQHLKELSSRGLGQDAQSASLGDIAPHVVSPFFRQLGLADPTILSPEKRLVQALRNKDVASLASLLDEKRANRSFLTQIPKATWTQILWLLDSRNFFPPLHSFHRTFNKARLRNIGYNANKAKRSFMATVIDIIRLRRDQAILMSTGEYRILLRHAAMMGNVQLARAIWSDMKLEKLDLDVLVYNAMMRAIVWDEDSIIHQKSRTRKSTEWSPNSPTNIVTYRPGASPALRDLWTEMRQANILPNTDTYCTLLTALSRDGHFEEIEQIFADVFHIDVDAVMEGKETNKEPLEPSSTIYPDHRLLDTIAEVFGIDNRVPTALRLIDHVSNMYNIPISRSVWYKISKWTYLQASLPVSARAIPVARPLKLEDVSALGDMMQSEPYNVTPDLETLDILFRSHIIGSQKKGATSLFETRLQHLEQGRLEYIRLINQYRNLSHQLRNVVGTRHAKAIRASSIAKLEQAVKNALLKKRRAQITLQRWSRRVTLLKSLDFNRGGPQREFYDEWTTVGLPEFLLRWRSFMPHLVKYRISTGTVELVLRTPEERDRQRRHKAAAEQRRSFVWLDSARVDRKWLGEPRREEQYTATERLDFRENADVAGWRDERKSMV